MILPKVPACFAAERSHIPQAAAGRSQPAVAEPNSSHSPAACRGKSPRECSHAAPGRKWWRWLQGSWWGPARSRWFLGDSQLLFIHFYSQRDNAAEKHRCYQSRRSYSSGEHGQEVLAVLSREHAPCLCSAHYMRALMYAPSYPGLAKRVWSTWNINPSRVEPFLLWNFKTTFSPSSSSHRQKFKPSEKKTSCQDCGRQQEAAWQTGTGSGRSSPARKWLFPGVCCLLLPHQIQIHLLGWRGAFWALKGTTSQSGGATRDPTICHSTIWLPISQKLLGSQLYSTSKGTE